MKLKTKRVLLGLVCVAVIAGGGLFLAITNGLKEGKEVVINNVDMQNVEDGVYEGMYSKDRWESKVKVTVQDNEIKTIELLSEPLTPNISQELFDEVIDTQSIDIDVVSGATVTSKAHLKSIENALNK